MKQTGKKIAAAVIVTSLIFVMTACKSSDAVKDDLYTYLTDMAEVQELQKEAINEYNDYVSGEKADSQQLLTALDDSIIPKYQNYLTELNAVSPETEEVQNVKAVCVEGANKQMEALQKVAEAIEACDAEMLNEADGLITESEALFADYESQLQALASEHEITLVNTGGQTGEAAEDAGTEAE